MDRGQWTGRRRKVNCEQGALPIRAAPHLCERGNEKAFEAELQALANSYREHGLPVPPYEVLRIGEVGEVRKCMETLMVCEAKGHLWKEHADPENGTSTLTCRRCGAEEHLRW